MPIRPDEVALPQQTQEEVLTKEVAQIFLRIINIGANKIGEAFNITKENITEENVQDIFKNAIFMDKIGKATVLIEHAANGEKVLLSDLF